jgi:hypothetical protein
MICINDPEVHFPTSELKLSGYEADNVYDLGREMLLID